jgi:precorrin-6B C5,15-methyltransferase / cobalt-precorrin-6B C5,C15-methyltransferase
MSDAFTIIGLSDSPAPLLHSDALEAVGGHHVFAGGARHRMIVEKLLPKEFRWITIAPPITSVMQELRQEPEPVLVFTSGDPLFYGFGATLQRAFPQASYRYFPFFHSLQMLAHRAGIPYQSMRYASLTGRGWEELDSALLYGERLIGVLTDKVKTPAALAKRLLEYRYTDYTMIVGEALGGLEERLSVISPDEAAGRSFHELNCVLLTSDTSAERYFGIPDEEFEGLPGRPNMITKMPVRLVTLSRLNLVNAANFWDIGFCTGSVSIEIKQQFPSIEVTSFEKRPECDGIFERNTRKFRVPGIRKVMGDFFEHDLQLYTGKHGRVDGVFIGGHGNRMAEMFSRLHPLLSCGARIVVNAVLPATLESFHGLATAYGYHLLDDQLLATGDHNPITIAAAEKTD